VTTREAVFQPAERRSCDKRRRGQVNKRTKEKQLRYGLFWKEKLRDGEKGGFIIRKYRHQNERKLAGQRWGKKGQGGGKGSHLLIGGATAPKVARGDKLKKHLSTG